MEKTVLRSIRIPKSLDIKMVREARAENVSVNNLISSILKTYDEFQRPSKEYGYVLLTQESLREIVERESDAELAAAGSKLGKVVPQSIISFWYGRVDSGTFTKYLNLSSTHLKWANFSISYQPTSTLITAHHNLGPKWSVFISSFFSAAIEKILKVHPRTEAHVNSVDFEIPGLQLAQG